MLHGTYHFGRRRVACRNAYCTTCRAPRFAEGFKSLVVLHIGFIPILPIAITTRWFCSICHKEVNARRPSRPWILVAGVAFGLFMALAGVIVLVQGHRKESPWPCIVPGSLIVAVLVYMLRKQDYAGYVVGRELVTPLSADWCPYCKSPLPPAETPRCPSCKVNILTK